VVDVLVEIYLELQHQENHHMPKCNNYLFGNKTATELDSIWDVSKWVFGSYVGLE
jgi:hypothetical protein